MSRVFWDTNLFIYLFEGQGEPSNRVAALRQRMRERGDELFTSTLTFGEVLVKPIEDGNTLLKQKYEDILHSQTTLIDFDFEAALIYATIRKDRTIKAPDAIQLACAAKAQVDLFITNDDRLSRKIVPGIHFIASLENAPL